jgi:hypothetical protein
VDLRSETALIVGVFLRHVGLQFASWLWPIIIFPAVSQWRRTLTPIGAASRNGSNGRADAARGALPRDLRNLGEDSFREALGRLLRSIDTDARLTAADRSESAAYRFDGANGVPVAAGRGVQVATLSGAGAPTELRAESVAVALSADALASQEIPRTRSSSTRQRDLPGRASE